MHEGMLPAITELILGLCFGIINVRLTFPGTCIIVRNIWTLVYVRVRHANCELFKFMGLTKL